MGDWAPSDRGSRAGESDLTIEVIVSRADGAVLLLVLIYKDSRLH